MFGDYGKFLESDYRKNRDMIRVNILALTEMTYRFGKLMVERGKGKILNVASIAGLCPGPYMNVYYATKAYVLSFSEAMAEELKGTGVTCTCLCPGPTQTNFWQRANVTASPIMKFFKPDTADHVAYKGVEGLMKKRVVVFNNVSGQLLNLAVRVMPRVVIRKSVGFMNGRR
nr:SDR family NAD(P)-dependent oxidoreductase [uncultured Sharpea sp.]